ncbi:MAG: PD40 domain-containing protein [Planctomycetes bacterium]|nr:PD40 domain-containing protein [Planctomycetota bacterium]
MKRITKIWLVGGISAVILSGVGAIAWHLRTQSSIFYTDADAIRRPIDEVKPRDILWRPAVKLSDEINSSADEKDPAVGAGAMTIYFARANAQSNADIYYASKTANGWTTPKALLDINTDADERGPALSADGSSLYFYSDRAGGFGGYDLWVASRGDSGWLEPINLGEEVNSAYNDYGPCLTPDGSRVYFTSNRPKLGATDAPSDDAWLTEIKADYENRDYDLYSAAIDATQYGPARVVDKLNTSANESAPAISPAGDFIYFTSDRTGGSGGFDIYRARILPDGLADPTNLGDTLNTEFDELSPELTLRGFGIYFSSARNNHSFDIYYAESREVFAQTETYRASVDWASLWPYLLGMLLGLLGVLLSLLLLQAAQRLQYKRLNLIARCLLASLLVHMCLMLLLSAWGVGSAISDMLKQGQAVQVALVSNASGSDLAAQLRGELTKLEVSESSEQSQRSETPAVEAEISPAETSFDVARLEIQEELTPLEVNVDKNEAEPSETELSQEVAVNNIEKPSPSTASLNVEIVRVDKTEAQQGEAPSHETSTTPQEARNQTAVVEATRSQSATFTPETAAISLSQMSQEPTAVIARAVDNTRPQLPQALVNTPLDSESAALDINGPVSDYAPVDRNEEAPRKVEAASGIFPRQDSNALASIDEALPSSVVVAPASATYQSVGESFAVEIANEAIVAMSPTDLKPADAEFADSVVSVIVDVPEEYSIEQVAESTLQATNAEPLGSRTDAQLPLANASTNNSSVAITPLNTDSSNETTKSFASAALEDTSSPNIAQSSDLAQLAITIDGVGSIDVMLPEVSEQSAVATTKPVDSALLAENTLSSKGEINDTVNYGSISESVVLVAPAVVENQSDSQTSIAKLKVVDAATQKSQQPSDVIHLDEALFDIAPIATDIALLEEANTDLQIVENKPYLLAALQTPQTAAAQLQLEVDEHIAAPITIYDSPSPVLLYEASLLKDVYAEQIDAELMLDPLSLSELTTAPLLAIDSIDIDIKLPLRQAAAPDIYKQRATEQREELIERMGGSQETEQAVTAALDWLARHQSQDGRWDGSDFDDNCNECEGRTKVEVDIALTGLALLAFLGADNTHFNQGPYQETVDRGINWLLKQQRTSGDLIGDESMYSHGMASIALTEAFGMTGDPRLLEPVTKAISFIYAARNTRIGGWRYAPGQVGDTSVLGWQMMALTSAKRSGLDVPDGAFDVAANWLKLVSRVDQPGRYSYQPEREVTPAMTAEAMFVQQLLGKPRTDVKMQFSADYLLENLPNWENDLNTYYWYYATLALYQHQGDAWDNWNDRMKDQLVAHQRTDGLAAGSWDPDGPWADVGGRVYQTAICALTLEVYYRYLPRFLSAETAHVPNMIRGKVTDARTGAVLAGAVIRIDLSADLPLTVVTNEAGRYVLVTPQLPDFVALSASHEGYLPEASNVASSELKRSTVTRDFQLKPLQNDIIAIEAVPEVHHLGNDLFDGRINSLFQKKSEGLVFTAEFVLTANQIPPFVNHAEIVLMVKGVQVGNELRINGNLLEARLNRSPRDGSFSEFVAEFPASWLLEGINTLQIKSVRGSDLDDFEFVNIQIRLGQ